MPVDYISEKKEFSYIIEKKPIELKDLIISIFPEYREILKQKKKGE